MARRHQGFQKQIAVIAGHIAITDAAQASHQVDAASGGIARKCARVQAQHADHGKGDRPLRHHAAKGDPAHKEALALGCGGESVLQQFAYHRQPQQRIFVAGIWLGSQVGDGPMHDGQRGACIGIAVIHVHQRIHALTQHFGPATGRVFLLGQLAPSLQFA